MVNTIHSVNGKFKGVYYDLPSGRKIYLAHRTPGKMLKPKMAWAIEEYVLRKCQAEGITVIGIVLRLSGKQVYYLTPLSDFHCHPSSYQYFGDSVARALPAKCFMINPGTCPDAIEKISTIGR